MMMVNKGMKKIGLKWRSFVRCYKSGTPSIEASIIKQRFLPLLCVGSTSCKGYIIALHQLTSPTLLRMLADAASHCGSLSKDSRSLTISCEPDAFEATFCLLQRSFKGLVHIPLSHNSSEC